VKFAGKSDRGLARSQNEDAFCIISGTDHQPVILAVADGMGGHKAGNVASGMAMQILQATLQQDLSRNQDEDAIKKKLAGVVKKANQAIYKRSMLERECEGMGTTLIITAVMGSKMIVAHVGDSCVYLFRNRTLQKVTTDHTYVEELVRIGTLTREEAMVHPKRNYITRAVGCTSQVEADLFAVELEPADRLLLCSDGLNKMLPEDEILNIIYSSDDPDKLCGDLIEMSNRRGGIDNITALVFLNVDEV